MKTFATKNITKTDKDKNNLTPLLRWNAKQIEILLKLTNTNKLNKLNSYDGTQNRYEHY